MTASSPFRSEPLDLQCPPRTPPRGIWSRPLPARRIRNPLGGRGYQWSSEDIPPCVSCLENNGTGCVCVCACVCACVRVGVCIYACVIMWVCVSVLCMRVQYMYVQHIHCILYTEYTYMYSTFTFPMHTLCCPYTCISTVSRTVHVPIHDMLQCTVHTM